MRLLSCLCFLLSVCALTKAQNITLENFAAGFEFPVDIAHAGDDRLFVVEKTGAIKILNADGTTNPTPFLDIDPIVNSQANEQGLLGLAFHPDYSNNGYFFVSYTASSDASVISRFSVSSDPNVADPNSEKLVFTTDQPFSNHNGGCIKFSPADGYLYIGIGDGGAGGDPQDNGQDRTSYLGKILRLDINSTGPYTIPADNPFVNDDFTQDEIWSLGWRNPWRFSFDRETNDMWIGDVGQNEWEEIDMEAPGDGGRNYGWRCYEGVEQFNFNGCEDDADYTFPIYVYANSSFNQGCSVTGGFVYRGQNYPSLQGSYIFADYCSGQFWTTRASDCGFVTTTNIKGDRNEYSSFGEDANGELYVTAIGEGRVYKIGTDCDLSVNAIISAPSCVGAMDGSIQLEFSGSADISSVMWSSGDMGAMLSGLAEGEISVTIEDESGCVLERCFVLDAPEAEPSCEGDILTIEACEDEAIVIIAPCDLPAGFMIRWYKDGELIDGENNVSLEVSGGGLYSLQFFDANCAREISDVVSFVTLAPDPAPGFVQDGNTLVADPGYFQYIWFANGVEVQSGSSNILAIDQDGLYSVQGRNNMGCLTLISDEVVIALSNTLDELGITRLDIFPNPFETECNLKMELFQAQDVKIQVVNTRGAVLSQEIERAKSQINHTIQLDALPAGVYMIKIEIDNNQLVRKIIKQ